MVIVKKFCVHTRSRADPAIEIVTNKRAERQDLRTSIELKRAEEDVKRAETRSTDVNRNFSSSTGISPFSLKCQGVNARIRALLLSGRA